ncbi:hypothetical protein HA466_0034740 [Hirschfeldia incana]|nr:hypothetical protein HA466_0034740 [Hirschfeldia incana]KAJ0263043.1 hypothetical protein HA466_0034740 [Hirschfeldia incana]KAJ0263044.1 hypothetical protein HA466_0034740 [Hirschfeldia incana]
MEETRQKFKEYHNDAWYESVPSNSLKTRDMEERFRQMRTHRRGQKIVQKEGNILTSHSHEIISNETIKNSETENRAEFAFGMRINSLRANALAVIN